MSENKKTGLKRDVRSCQLGTRPSSPDQWLQRCSPLLQWSSQPLDANAHRIHNIHRREIISVGSARTFKASILQFPVLINTATPAIPPD